MGLDLHVIPISAFVVGDYEPAMALAFRSMGMSSVPLTVIRVDGEGPSTFEQITAPRGIWGQLQRWTGLWALRRAVHRWKARNRRGEGLAYVAWLKEALQRVGIENPDWCEEGGSVLTRQFRRSYLHALQSYALRVEFPEVLGKAGAGGDPLDTAIATLDLADQLQVKSVRFRHLCDHSDGDGYYLPMSFDSPKWLLDPVDPETGERAETKTSVGSGIRLRDELMELNQSLGLSERWDTSKMGTGTSEKDPYLQEVHAGWLLMEGFVRTSLQHRLPICFD